MIAQLAPRPRHSRITPEFLAMGGAVPVVPGVIGYRACSVFDVVANGVGILVAWVLPGTGLSSILARWAAVRAREAATRESESQAEETRR